MCEITRIADLLEETFGGTPYYGPSVLMALENVTAEVAAQRPRWSAHSIWDLVAHLTAELDYARAVIQRTAVVPWVEGQTTWPPVIDRSEAAWREAIESLKQANRALVRVVRHLDDDILEQEPIQVRGPYYLMLHGTMQHNIFYSGQISLLTGQIVLGNEGETK